MGQAAEACPVVLARGLTLQPSSSGSGTLLRLKAQDLFR
jgi:coenzyme F420-0:L-glutamate ligase/coenzyme F420-1:gamma-L-glutamate ligase